MLTDIRTDGQIATRTNRPFYRDVWTHQEMGQNGDASFLFLTEQVPRKYIRCDYFVFTHYSIVTYTI